MHGIHGSFVHGFGILSRRKARRLHGGIDAVFV